MEVKISEVLNKYDTDKIWHHHYGNAYDDFFKDFDQQAQLNILEIGTQKGGSLLAWKEYFPNSSVTGIDIIDVVPEKYKKDNVTRIISDIKEWKTEKKFDIVIDDGSHYLGDLVYVISQYVIKLNEEGVLIIEDVRNPQLLYSVIIDLMKEIRLGFPEYQSETTILVKSYDNRRIGAESSYIMALFKKPKE